MQLSDGPRKKPKGGRLGRCGLLVDVIKTSGRAKLMLVKVILIFSLFLNKPILFFNFVQAMMMRWSEG